MGAPFYMKGLKIGRNTLPCYENQVYLSIAILYENQEDKKPMTGIRSLPVIPSRPSQKIGKRKSVLSEDRLTFFRGNRLERGNLLFYFLALAFRATVFFLLVVGYFQHEAEWFLALFTKKVIRRHR
jgi:hypothetical protein